MFHCLPNSAWAHWNLTEAAGQLGNMVENLNQSQPNPTQVHEQMRRPVYYSIFVYKEMRQAGRGQEAGQEAEDGLRRHRRRGQQRRGQPRGRRRQGGISIAKILTAVLA